MPGLVAVVVAIGAVLAGKYYAASYVVEKIIRQERHNITAVSDDEAIAHIADEIAAEKESGGATLSWPDGERPPIPTDPTEYPPAVAQEARQKWASAKADWKQDYTNRISREKDQRLNESKDVVKAVGFVATFSIFDLLWFPLAIASAYRAGSHSQSES